MTLPVRRAVAGRPARVARASAGLSVTRVLAAGAVLAAAASLYGATSSRAFLLSRIDVSGTVLASRTDVVAVIERTAGERPNLFRVRTAELEGQIARLAPVLAAEVRVVLPDRLVVAVTERRPILVWATAGRRSLADAEGVIVGELGVPRSELAFVEDRREGSPPAVGGRLDPIDLAVARQLAALTPSSLGSRASRLRLAVDDRDGWTLTAEPEGWRAVFGVYAARIRSPDVVPLQVQCLGALLASEEPRLATIYLAPARDRCGTFRPRGG